VRLVRGTRVEFDPLTGYGRSGARGTIVDVTGDQSRVRLDTEACGRTASSYIHIHLVKM